MYEAYADVGKGIPGRGNSISDGAKVENMECIRGTSGSVLWREQRVYKGKKSRTRLGWKSGARLRRASNRRLRKLDFIL